MTSITIAHLAIIQKYEANPQLYRLEITEQIMGRLHEHREYRSYLTKSKRNIFNRSSIASKSRWLHNKYRNHLATCATLWFPHPFLRSWSSSTTGFFFCLVFFSKELQLLLWSIVCASPTLLLLASDSFQRGLYPVVHTEKLRGRSFLLL